MKTNKILDSFADQKLNLIVRLLEKEEPEENDMVLIEGSSQALSFLGKLLLAHAEDEEDGVQISPKGAGRVFFSKESTLGIYIHRLRVIPKV
ncbi:MAG TPA: hypothetical protein VGO50_12240 [Pyrinomonadaceae bacterium]|jgi:hypothetical protein|nr:hypothetical protein [Pyrinomonadaceae bacterium]